MEGNEDAKARPPIQWGRVLLSALLAAIVALALIVGGIWVLGQNPGDILDRLCPPELVTCPEPDPTGSIIGDIVAGIGAAIACGVARGIACVILITLWALVIYFPLAAIISIILIRLMVRQRRLIHTILSVVLSVPIAYGLLFLLSRIL
jgi:ABC-type phosphate transport system permease subunit